MVPAEIPAEERQSYRMISRSAVRKTRQWSRLDAEVREAIEIVSLVLPFRTNRYVVDHLIDWDRVPDDPMFQLTFPQRGMLDSGDYSELRDLVTRNASEEEIARSVSRIRADLNPQPSGQKTHNIPTLDGVPLPGLQHKYAETMLFFPKRGQTCHAYCSYCFRWAQFVRIKDIRFAAPDANQLITYLRRHPEVTDVVVTGGDPMVTRTAALASIVGPLLDVDHLLSIRIGTKSVATWPYRFVTDDDADAMLRLFERVVARGKQLALMAHYSHPVELSTDPAREAIRRIRSTGANVRMQSPVARHINDDASTWAEMWREGTRLGCIPYYMFVVRDTGPQRYFEIPLARTWEIFQGAYQQVSGLARTVRGPSMSALPGKVHILGTSTVDGQPVFVLEYLQARDPNLVRRPFFARWDAHATWFDELEPARDADRPFFPTPTT